MDFQNILKQAQEMQARLAKLQEELAQKTVEASAGGGMVTVTANGRQEILSVRIEKEVISPQEADLLQDLVRAAVNEALSRSREMIASEMSKVTGGMNLPGLP
ncbi:MAG: YbaB/EbfC family nucleoid-associated protein [Deltaproteobacteria bacterium]|nr:YbaB/EbfC family nucleoid-associated protein [Deltaproteobacteria bacterium]